MVIRCGEGGIGKFLPSFYQKLSEMLGKFTYKQYLVKVNKTGCFHMKCFNASNYWYVLIFVQMNPNFSWDTGGKHWCKIITFGLPRPRVAELTPSSLRLMDQIY